MKKILATILMLGCIWSVSGSVYSKEGPIEQVEESCGLLLGIQSTVSVFIAQLSREIVPAETNVSRYATIYYSRDFFANEIKKVFVPKIKDKDLQLFFAKIAVALGKQKTYSGTQEDWKIISKKVADDLMSLNAVINEKRKTLDCKF